MATGTARSSGVRWAAGVARALLWVVVFIAATVLGLILHADVPALREAFGAALNRSLDGSYRGQLQISSLDHLGVSNLSARRVDVKDEHGRLVLSLEGVKMRYRPLVLLGGLFGADRDRVVVDHLRVDVTRVVLVTDPESGEWTLVRALSKVKPPGPRRVRAPLSYAFSAIELGELEVLAEHPSVGKIEASIQHVQGTAELGGEDNAVSVEGFGVHLIQSDNLVLKGTGSLRLLGKGRISGAFHGFIHDLEVDASLEVDGEVLTLRLDVPSASPEQARRVLPGWPLQAPATAQIRAEGPLSLLQVRAEVRASGSSVELTGDVDLTRAPTARLSLRGHALDARLFSPTAPPTSIEARATLEAMPGGASGPTLRVEAETDPTTVAGVSVPAAQVSLHVEGSRWNGKVRLADARGSVDADVALLPDEAVEVNARVQRLDLRAWPELQGRVDGHLDLEARIRIADGRLAGSMAGQFRELGSGAVTVRQGNLEATFDGLVSELARTELKATLNGTAITLGPLQIERARVRGDGTWRRARFEAVLTSVAGGHGAVEGTLVAEPVVELQGAKVTWSEPGISLGAQVASWSMARGALRVNAFQVSGAVGKLSGSLELGRDLLHVIADAEQLDTRLLARTLGLSRPWLGGLVSGHGELSTGPAPARGALDVEVRQVTLGDLSMGAVTLQAQLGGSRVDAKVAAVDAALGQLSASMTGELAGSVLELASWQRATGAGSAKIAGVPLWPVGLLLPKSSRVKDLDGRLDVALEIERKDPTAPPSVFLQAGTRELTFAMTPSDATEGSAVPFEHFAVHASASIDGPSGYGAATVLVTDEHGALVTTSGSLELDLPLLLVQPETILQKLFEAPLDALVRLHPRPLSRLPSPFALPDLAGTVEATLQLRGSLREPTLTLAARANQLLGSFADARRAVDVSGIVYYTPNTGQLTGHAEVAQAGQSLVTARLEGNFPSPLATEPDGKLLELRAAAMLNGLPLELWPVAAREQIEARLYGSFDVEQRGSRLEQRAHLEIGELSVAGHALGNGSFSFENNAAGTQARFRVGSPDHYLRFQLHGAATETAGATQTIEGSLVARDFDAASLSPLASGILTRLGGVIDADLAFSVRSGSDDYVGVNGRAKLKGGSAHIDELGLEVREIQANLSARSTPDYTVLQIEPVEAKARSRTPNLRGDAELWLRGFRVVNAEANLALNEVPLSLKGASRGVARGHVKARLERMADHVLLEIKIPDLRVKLPASSTRTLISLEPNRDLNVLQAKALAEPRPAPALLWKIGFQLGDAVRIQRGDLDIPLTGEPRVEYRHEIEPSGTIEALPGGHITLFDQTFSVDRAVVQLIPEEPDNPRVDLTASWRAPDGTTVYVDITGTAKEASVLTRDDRGLQDVERFYLITGTSGGVGGSSITRGSAAPSARLDSGDAGPSDSAAIGQTFAFGINELLRESIGNVAVSVGTSANDRASYGASVRLSDKVSFQGNFQPASDSNLEESANDLTGTLDYRFTQHWSLRTELGTSGGAFDLLWSYRY